MMKKMENKDKNEDDITNELTTVLGYYTLFQSNKAATSSSSSSSSSPPKKNPLHHRNECNNNNNNNSNDNDDDEKINDETNIFWQEDTWTESHLQSAQHKLTKYQSKCDIATSSITGQFMISKYEQDACRNWDAFYERNTTNFFKDRHYLSKAFPVEFGFLCEDGNNLNCDDDDDDDDDMVHNDEKGDKVTSKTIPATTTKDCKEEKDDNIHATNDTEYVVVEIGCGVGNAVLPLLERSTILANNKNNNEKETPKLSVWGLDFSAVAINLLKQDPRFLTAQKDDRAKAAVWDITSTPPQNVMLSSSDGKKNSGQLYQSANVSMLLFCLSAINPTKMKIAAKHVSDTLQPGGTLILRDYGRYDEAQMKLGTSRNKRLSDNFYVKSDGTRCYYFSLEDLKELFGSSNAGLDVLELKYIRRVYKNRAVGLDRRRVWVQGRFQKPFCNTKL